MWKKYIGDKKFYRMVVYIALPIILQNVITNFVNMLDNIMVGQLGTLEMSGVSIANQLLMIFNLTIFGSITAAGIFGAQYMGKNDMEGVKNCLKAKFYITTFFSILGILLFIFVGKDFISLYLNNDVNSAADIAYTLSQAYSYIMIMCLGLLPFSLSQSIGGTIRESGDTVLPMVSSIVAVSVNFVGNLVLIFGLLGLPKMGVLGAATATVLSRFAELIVIAIGAFKARKKHTYFSHIFQKFTIPKELAKNIMKRGTPLLVNEVLWSFGMAAISQCYSTRGLDSVAAFNISNTIQNIFFTVVIGMGSAISIIVGRKLGANQIEDAIDTDRKIIALSIVLCTIVGILMILTAPIFPQFYQTSDHVREISTTLLRIVGLFLPIASMYNSAYFTLRSGGKTFITFLFDAGSTLAISFPAAFILSRFTTLNVIEMFFIVSSLDIIKATLGLYLVHKRVWVNNLTV